MTMVRIGLVGCVAGKLDIAAPARDLYISPLFRGRRRWVEATCDEWYVLSAMWGLVHPDTIVQPYNWSLDQSASRVRVDWSHRVLGQIADVIGTAPGRTMAGYTFEIHAGAAYRKHGLEVGLMARGAEVWAPTEGLPIGAQLALYADGPPPPPRPTLNPQERP
jgi:hypothetical protein